MFWILLAGILVPALLVALVLTRDRYLPWLSRRRAAISLGAGLMELVVAVASLVRGIRGPQDWVRIVSSGVLGIAFIWLSRRESAVQDQPKA